MANPLNLIYSSDYNPAYVILTLNRNYTLTSGGYGVSNLDTIPHGLPFPPLMDGVWGFNSDLSDARSIADTHRPRLTSMADLIIEVSSDENNIYIYCDNFEFPSSTHTFYFKLWGYMDPTYAASINADDDSTNYKFSSDFNYLKTAFADKISIGASSTATVTHNLGFKPRVIAWLRRDFGFTANNTFQIQKTTIDTNTISISNTFSSTKQAAYHIYANE